MAENFNVSEVEEITISESLKGDANYFNVIGKLSCGTMMYSARHYGKYMEESCFGNEKGVPNSIILLGDGRVLIMIWPSLGVINNHVLTDKIKSDDVGKLFVSYLNSMSQGIGNQSRVTSALVLMHKHLYVELEFIIEYIKKIFKNSVLNRESLHIASYLFSNLYWWSSLAQDTKSFFGADLARFSKVLKSSYDSLREILNYSKNIETCSEEDNESEQVYDISKVEIPSSGCPIPITGYEIGKMGKLFIDINRASRIVGTSASTLKRRSFEGELPFYYNSNSRKYIFKRSDVQEYKNRFRNRKSMK